MHATQLLTDVLSSMIWTVTQQEVLYEEVFCSSSGQTVPVIQEGILEPLWSERTVVDHSWWGIWNQTAAANFFIGNVGTIVKSDWEEECHLLTKFTAFIYLLVVSTHIDQLPEYCKTQLNWNTFASNVKMCLERGPLRDLINGCWVLLESRAFQ